MRSTIYLIALVCFPLSFGGIKSHAWTISMDFNKGTLGETVQDGGRGYPVFSDAAGDTVYSKCDGFSLGSQCASMSIGKGCDGWAKWGGRVNFTQSGLSNLRVGDQVWVSFKLFIPADFDYSAQPHLKFVRFHTAAPSGSNEGYNDLYITPDGPTHWDAALNKQTDAPFFFVKEQQNLLRFIGQLAQDKPLKGKWETYEMYMFMDSVPVKSGGRSRVRFWKNGKLLAELDDVKTLNTNESLSPSFLLFTYWNGGNPSCTGTHPTKTQSLYIDDLILTTEQPSGRDEFGNAIIGNMINGSVVGVKPKPPVMTSISR